MKLSNQLTSREIKKRHEHFSDMIPHKSAPSRNRKNREVKPTALFNMPNGKA